MRDPDSDWVNAGTYRNQVFDGKHLGVYISPGKHGRMIREKYFDRGERVPIVVVVGSDPLLFMAACSEAPRYGMSEFEWAGAVRGGPVEVVPGEVTGLPIPAHAEIAIEGFIDPVARRSEGPYGEAYGYYSERVAECPFVTVERVYYQNDPIILGCPQGKPPHEDNRFGAYLRSTVIREQLTAAGIPRVTGVWVPPEAGNRGFVVVAIQQAYPGHATQAGIVASQAGGVAYLGRYVVVVDEDIDIYSMNDVWWAMLTRVDPARDVQIIRRGWAGPLDQAAHPDERGLSSRMVIDATKPWEWKDRFAEPVVTAEMARATREQFGWILEGEPAPA
jgi:4-hydroxy-3-polyprenylbenzoate decarboxylase